jgi:F-type H+-transporting ATPase subunit b
MLEKCSQNAALRVARCHTDFPVPILTVPSNMFRTVAPRLARPILCRRHLSTTQPPTDRANEIINKLPSSPNLVTKTGTAILGSGLLAAAISQELYVMNEESVVAIGTLILFTYLAKAAREPYKDWADGHINRIKAVLDNARSEHTQAVKDRIESVEDMKDVVSLTKALFALSKVLS